MREEVGRLAAAAGVLAVAAVLSAYLDKAVTSSRLVHLLVGVLSGMMSALLVLDDER